MDFEWNDIKEAQNLRKHGIRFAESVTTWGDPLSQEYQDVIHSVDEERYIRIGKSIKDRVLVTVFCEREAGDVIRIISSRRAIKSEVNEYEK